MDNEELIKFWKSGSRSGIFLRIFQHCEIGHNMVGLYLSDLENVIIGVTLYGEFSIKF